ncbi:tyrosine-type recombinase/integrase [Actinoplanes sp. NPDC051859]|uniref:tyrosine-type recombinase/integrase n=1 Tax=Actinoplanes sp. NPDC051859 TaxID=3363909 RepID=UPI0037A46D53
MTVHFLMPSFTALDLRKLLPDSVNAFIEDSRAQGHSEKTIYVRVELLTRVNSIVISEGLSGLEDMTRQDIARWLAGLKLSSTSKATYFSHLRAYFNFLVVTGRLPASPMEGMKRPKENQTVPRPLPAADVARLLAIEEEPYRTAVRLALYAGLRAMEIAKLTRENITEDSISVVAGKGGKNAHLPTHPIICEMVRDRGPGPVCPDPVTGGHMNADQMSCRYAYYVTRLGMPKCGLHRLRHTYATKLLRGGANIRVVQELMRHSSLATTARYTAVDDDEKRAALAVL